MDIVTRIITAKDRLKVRLTQDELDDIEADHGVLQANGADEKTLALLERTHRRYSDALQAVVLGLNTRHGIPSSEARMSGTEAITVGFVVVGCLATIVFGGSKLLGVL